MYGFVIKLYKNIKIETNMFKFKKLNYKKESNVDNVCLNPINMIELALSLIFFLILITKQRIAFSQN